jgi:hypothetical protein
MKKITGFLAILIVFGSCSPVPIVDSRPVTKAAQMKIMTGSQSAKRFAPGRQDKRQ